MDYKKKLKRQSSTPSIKKKDNKINRLLKKRSLITQELKMERDYSDDKILIPGKFLKSIRLDELKFTNKVDLDKNNKHIIDNLKLILGDTDFLISNVRQVTIDTKNKRRLKSIILGYDRKWIEDETIEGDNLFKVNGITTKLDYGKKTEIVNMFRVYLRVTENNRGKMIYKLIFVDPYHLAIPSSHNGKPAQIMQQQTFSQYRYCGEHLEILINQLH